MNGRRWIALLALLVLGAMAVENAEARRGSRGKDRVREKVRLAVDASSPLTVRQAYLKVERRGLPRQMVKIELKAAERGADLVVEMADAAGTLVQVGTMRESRPCVYKWRVRTRKGDALPFGVSDVADLSGRAVEVVTAAGQTVAGADFPSLATAGLDNDSQRIRLRAAMSVSDSDDDSSIDARVEVRRKKDGRQEWKVEVDHAPAGLSLEAWMDDGTGTFAQVGSLEERVTDRGSEYEIERKSDEGGLPFGATDLSELSGRSVEVRDGSGEVLASGFVPRLAAGTSGKALEGTGGSDDDGPDEADDEAEDENEAEDEDEDDDEDESEDEDDEDESEDEDESDENLG
jgi:hypothetical protein